MVEYPQEIINVDKEFWENPEKYKERINQINTLFELDANGFMDNHPPTFFAGKLDKIKYILVGLNPGYNEKRNKVELDIRKNTRHNNLEDCENVFTKCFGVEGGFWPPYYSRIIKFFPEYDKNQQSMSKKQMAEFCENNLANIDAFPFHSKEYKISIPDLTINQANKLLEYWGYAKKLIALSSAKYVIMIGKSNVNLIMLDKSINFDSIKQERITCDDKKIHFYTFDYIGKKFILIDAFIAGGLRPIKKELLNQTKEKLRELLTE